jgi:SCY1-like protein 2
MPRGLRGFSCQTRLNALACIDRLLDSLDKMMILDEVLPFLTEIQVQDVDIIMSVIGMIMI